ncbi:hypothetical protein Tco_1108857 [Tanacetum coccineum]
MVAFLTKSTGSAEFHQIIDFITRSHICYALTKKPEVCVSFIKQFWKSAEALTDGNGDVKINATIDGHSLSITEGSLRRHLKLDDQDGITSLPTTEIFEQLALMGYTTDSDKLTFQKDWSLLEVSQLRIGKKQGRKQARLFLQDEEVFQDDSSKQGRKLFDEEVQEKASTDTELFIQEVTPTEVIQDQESSEKASDEVSTAGLKKMVTASKEVPIVSTIEVNLVLLERTVTYSEGSAENKSRKDKE